ncbi:MAG: alpha-E domain-containing protein [Rhodobacteraceae bacterium]|nr:alpha-E domain-containing protein [Paracoccaceae bacterium]
MLSRTAEGLFWMSRYIERMSNIARLLDAGRRMDALPQEPDARSTEWASILISAGCRDSYPSDLDDANQANALAHLVWDEDNPSSIYACAKAARSNARAVRVALTSEVWDVINQTYLELRDVYRLRPISRDLVGFLDWVKERAALMRGMIASTMLRDDGYAFIEMGKWIERADATARLLDVKYHVLLPSAGNVGGGVDTLQWMNVLRATNSARAYRHVYRRTVEPRGVVDLLVLNRISPRSLITCITQCLLSLHEVAGFEGAQSDLVNRLQALQERLSTTNLDAIFTYGLHEWLTDFIIEVNNLAVAIGDAFSFHPPAPATLQPQPQ